MRRKIHNHTDKRKINKAPDSPLPSKSHWINAVKMTAIESVAPAPRGSRCLTWKCIYKLLCARAWGHSGSARQVLSLRKAALSVSMWTGSFPEDGAGAMRPPSFCCCHFLMQLRAHVSASQRTVHLKPGILASLCALDI